MDYVVQVDIVHVWEGDEIGHVHVNGELICASREGRHAYLVPDYGQPSLESNTWRNLVIKVARHYGLTGRVRIENEVTGKITEFEVK